MPTCSTCGGSGNVVAGGKRVTCPGCGGSGSVTTRGRPQWGRLPGTYAELCAFFPPETNAEAERRAAEAAQRGYPAETKQVLRQIFAGAGDRILARRAETTDAA